MADVLHTNPLKYWAANVSLSARLGRILHHIFIVKMIALRKQDQLATGMNYKRFALGVVAILLITGAAAAAGMVLTLGLGLGMGLFVGLTAAAAAHVFAGDYLYSKAGALTLAGAALMPFAFVLDVVFSPFSFAYACVKVYQNGAGAQAFLDNATAPEALDENSRGESVVTQMQTLDNEKVNTHANVIGRRVIPLDDTENDKSDNDSLLSLKFTDDNRTVQAGDGGTAADVYELPSPHA